MKRLLVHTVRVLCALYWIALTVLLLVPDPAALLGMKRTPGDVQVRGVHFAVFTGLAVLAAASRWPLSVWRRVALLVAYAVVTEGLQWWVPNRDVDAVDLIENLLGLTTGTAAWWMIERASQAVSRLHHT